MVIIPETDENAIRLTTEIHTAKTTLEERCNSLKVIKDELKLVGDQRREKFMGFFMKVSERLPGVYRELTKCEIA